MTDTRRGIRLTDSSLEHAKVIAKKYNTTISGAVRIALAEVAIPIELAALETVSGALEILHEDQYYWVIRNGDRLGAFVFSDGHNMGRPYSNPYGIDAYVPEIVRGKINRGGQLCRSQQTAAQLVADMADGKYYDRPEA